MTTKGQQIPNPVKFLFGGSAGMMATCFVQPLDLVKTRMQISGVGGKEKVTTVSVIKNVVQKEGMTGLYAGLSAALFRQASYTTVRMGVYNTLFDMYEVSYEGKSPSFAIKACMGMGAGAVGAFVGTPAEVSLIRMTSDGRLPLAERRNYKHIFDALIRITREEGLFTLWRGCIPTIGRAMVVNAAQLASYSQAKQFLLSTSYFRDNIMCHFVASMISGLVTTAASMPVDIAKTRIQNMKIVNGIPEYRGTFDVLGKVIRREGFFALWKGFTPYYARIGPHTVLTFIFLEQMNGAYKSYFMGISPSPSGK